MTGRVTGWIGRRHPSTYMLVIAWIVIGTVAHPALTNYIVVMLIGPWLFVARDLARVEGKAARFSPWGLIGAAAALSVLILVMITVRFVGV